MTRILMIVCLLVSACELPIDVPADCQSDIACRGDEICIAGDCLQICTQYAECPGEACCPASRPELTIDGAWSGRVCSKACLQAPTK
jgi:hypothetical protein